ncbi:alanine dehydrogenase [Bradyrhizobium sp. USDA 3397]
MTAELLYLSGEDIKHLRISSRQARETIVAAFRDYAAGRAVGLPKFGIDTASSWFSSMIAVSETHGIAATKWVAVSPDESVVSTRVNGLVCVSDYKTGKPFAVLDGNNITLIRTAATSAAAASYLAPEAPESIGLVGCGLQALSHLDSFVDLHPSLRKVYLFSRSPPSAEALAAAAAKKHREPIISNNPDTLVKKSDIVISMVPSSPGLESFLNGRLLQSCSFVSAVDGGRSWRSDSFTCFDRLVTDSLEQSASPVDAANRPLKHIAFQEDLRNLTSSSSESRSRVRTLFGFRGFAIADLAIADLAIRQARALGIGTTLPR